MRRRVDWLTRSIFLAIFLAMLVQGCDLLLPEKSPQEKAQECYNRGLALVQQGDFGQAARLFSEATQLDPGKGEYFMQHGMALIKNGESGQAVMSLSKAADMMPESVEPDWQLGLFYDGMNKPGQALKHFRKVLLKDDENIEVLSS